MFRVSCDSCGTDAYVECTCPDGHDPVTAGHLPEVALGGTTVPACPMGDLGANVVCPPESGCCQEDHSHDAAANSCPHIGLPHGERHGGAPCPEPPGKCKLHRHMNAAAHREMRAAGIEPPGCEGGHCHPDIPDCTVCRTVTITALPGSASVALAPAVKVGG